MLYVVYCHIDELEVWEPEVAKELRQKKTTDRGPYHYHLGRSGYVKRIPIDLKQFLYNHSHTERYTAATHPDQRRINEYVGTNPQV